MAKPTSVQIIRERHDLARELGGAPGEAAPRKRPLCFEVAAPALRLGESVELPHIRGCQFVVHAIADHPLGRRAELVEGRAGAQEGRQ